MMLVYPRPIRQPARLSTGWLTWRFKLMWRFNPLPRNLFVALASTAALSGCYADHWKQSEILVTTMPPGASCTLTRAGEKIAEISPTPGIALLKRGPDDVAIACHRSGYADATAVSHALGDAVDVKTLTEGRSGYDYESPIDITLTPSR